jgi:hypothetical protein
MMSCECFFTFSKKSSKPLKRRPNEYAQALASQAKIEHLDTAPLPTPPVPVGYR